MHTIKVMFDWKCMLLQRKAFGEDWQGGGGIVVHLSDLPAFVVAAYQRDPVRVAHLQNMKGGQADKAGKSGSQKPRQHSEMSWHITLDAIWLLACTSPSLKSLGESRAKSAIKNAQH